MPILAEACLLGPRYIDSVSLLPTRLRHTDPEGFIYYNNESDFEKGSNKNHIYEITVDSIGGRTYAVVMFRHSANAKPYAKVCYFLHLHNLNCD